jgi:hypothetical protein
MITPRARRLAIFGIVVVALCAYWQHRANSLPHLGAIATVTELTSGISLDARVDTGAQICSLHYEALEIPAADDDPEKNIGKLARFKIKGTNGETAWIESQLVDHAQIRTSTLTVARYFVRLPLRVEGVDGQHIEATVLVNLNNRATMRHPMLIGRNLLRDRFVVDIRDRNTDLDSD